MKRRVMFCFGTRPEAITLAPVMAAAFQLLPPAVQAAHRGREAALLESILAFVRDRQYGWLRDQGLAHDVVAAVLAECFEDPYRGTMFARQLTTLVATTQWKTSFTAYARCKRIVKDLTEQYALAPDLYCEDASAGLYKAWQAAQKRMDGTPPESQVATLGAVLIDLQPPIDRFFNDIRVMAEEPAVRQARLALVQRIAALSSGIGDLSQLSGF